MKPIYFWIFLTELWDKGISYANGHMVFLQFSEGNVLPSTTSTTAIPASNKVRALRPGGVGVAKQVLHFIANYFYPCRCLALSIQLCRQSLRVRSAHADIQEMRHKDFLPMREKEKNSEK